MIGYLYAREAEITAVRIIMRDAWPAWMGRPSAAACGPPMYKGERSMYKIAVVGDRDSVLGFKALGLEVCPAQSADEAREIIHRLAKRELCHPLPHGAAGGPAPE